MFGATSEVLPALLAAAPEGGTVADRLVSELRQRVSEVRATQGCTRNPPCVKSFLHLVMRPLTELCPRADPAAFAELAAALGVPHGVRCFSPLPRAVYLLSLPRSSCSSPPPCTARIFSPFLPGVARCITSTPARRVTPLLIFARRVTLLRTPARRASLLLTPTLKRYAASHPRHVWFASLPPPGVGRCLYYIRVGTPLPPAPGTLLLTRLVR